MQQRDFPHHCRTVDVTEYGSIQPANYGKWLISDYLMQGDYVDSCSRSNTRVFARDFAKGEGTWWRWMRGAIVIRTLAYRNSKDVRDTLDSLADYHLLDESDHSDLEQEDQQENWESWARSDFRRELRRNVEEHFVALGIEKDANGLEPDEIVDRITDEQVDVLFWELCQQEEQYPEACGSSEWNFPLVDLADIWGGTASTRKGEWYKPYIPPGHLPHADENGQVVYQTGEPSGWYPAFAVNPQCSRCGDEKILGTCREHVDCREDHTGEMGRLCSHALKEYASAWHHDCLDPECDAVRESERLENERAKLRPGYQFELAVA